MPQLSIVIAAYNEENRLPATLERMIACVEAQKISYEFVIVNDGSKDNTLAWLERYVAVHPQVRVLTHFPNRGRGASIREGVLDARGAYILETDADGSVDDEAIARFLRYFEEHPEVGALFGSRELEDSVIAQKQPLRRVLLGYGFIYLARLVFGLWRVSDFTLGFKMLRREAAHDIFARQEDNFFVAEAEIVYLAHLLGHPFVEMPVCWSDNRDSRVHALRDSIRSLKGIAKIRLHHGRKHAHYQ